MIRIVIIICMIVLATACQGKIENEEIPEILVAVNENSIDFSDLLEISEIVELETNNESLFGEIENIIFYKDKIVILDTWKTNSIYIFNKSGRFLNRINKIGAGPGEYSLIKGISIDTINNNVIALDFELKKLIYYDFNGTFIKEVKLEIVSFALNPYSGEYIAFNLYNVSQVPGNEYNLILKNVENDKQINLLPFNDLYSNMTYGESRTFTHYNNKLVFTPNFSKTIFLVENELAKPWLKMNFGNIWASDEFFKETDHPTELGNKIRKDNKVATTRTCVFQDHLIIRYFYKKAYRHYVYSIIKKEGLNIFEVKNTGDILKIPIETDYLSENMISTISSFELIKALENGEIADPKLTEIAKRTNLSNNPIIVKYKFSPNFLND